MNFARNQQRSPDGPQLSFSSRRRNSYEGSREAYHSSGSIGNRHSSFSAQASTDLNSHISTNRPSITSSISHNNRSSSYHGNNTEISHRSRRVYNRQRPYSRSSSSSSNYPSNSGQQSLYQSGHSAYVDRPLNLHRNGNQRNRGGYGNQRGIIIRKAAGDDSETVSLSCTENSFIAGFSDLPNAPPVPVKEELKILVNAYEVTTKKGKPVYQYSIQWKGENLRGKIFEDLNIQTKASQKLHVKQLALFDIFTSQLLNDNAAFFGYTGNEWDIVFDSGSIFYTHQKILGENEVREIEIDVNNFSQLAKDYYPNMAKLTATISFAGEIHPNRLTGRFSNDRPVLQYLSTVFNQEQRKKGDYYCFGNEFFEKASCEEISGTPIVLKSGVIRSIRQVGNPGNNTLLLHFIPKMTTFYESSSLIKLIEFETRRSINEIWSCFEVAEKTIKNLTVKTNHLQYNRTFCIQGLTSESADQITFFNNETKEYTTVAQYYLKKHHIKLQNRDLPCVLGNDSNAYPMQVLGIENLQKIPKAKQDEFRSLKIADKCSLSPAQNLEAIKKERENAEILNSNDYIKSTGCRVNAQKLVGAPAKLFYPPSVILKSTKKILHCGQFGMQRGVDRFLQPATVSKLACIVSSRSSEKQMAFSFFDQLMAHVKLYGVVIQNFKVFEWDNVHDYDRLLQLEKQNFTFIIIIGDEEDLHHDMKLKELEINVVTQHILCKTSEKFNFSILDHIAFKFNLRAGGINWSLSANPDMIKKFQNVDLLKSLMQNTLLFGMDLSHPSCQKKSVATCAGFASNIMKGHTSICKGDFGYQTAKQTYVDAELLADRFTSAIMTYFLKNGCFPSWIVVYRAGVSEGEIAEVQEYEIPELKNVIEELKKKYSDFRDGALTVIMSTERSNYRLFNEEKDINPDGKASEQNLPSGTCVSEKIVSEKLPTFILISQLPKLGTTKPTVYSVLEGENIVPLDQLQWLTYCLCYAHETCTSPTTLPAPLESAADLSKRASNNLKHLLKQQRFGESNYARESQNNKPPPDAAYFKNLNETLKATIKNVRFWA